MGRAQGAAGLLNPSGAAEAWHGFKAENLRLLALVEGDAVLDVGCGTGEDARAIARLVRGVSVIGVDVAEERIREAQRLTLGLPWPIDFQLGDAGALGFDDASFDACRADRVFHHLDDPGRALGEMTRVARPGARIVVTDPDYDTLVVDGPDPAVTRRIVGHHADRLEDGRVGRRLRGLFVAAGLHDVRVVPYTAVVTEFDDAVLKLREKAERAVGAGVVSADEAARWLADLDGAARAGRFLCALTTFTVAGTVARRPR